MGLSRLFTSVLLLVLMTTVASAYTIVMRDGRRVQIPEKFTVTNSTLTYEVNSGIQVTIQLNTVDIGATERANGETQGSFLMKATAPKAPVERAPQPRPTSAQRSITNGELEKYRRARVEGENEYENRRKELGLPSLEERRREVAAIDERTVEQVRNMRAQEEAYWRSRAEALRAEAAANEAKMGALRQGPVDVPWWSNSFGGFPAFGPFDNVGFGITGVPFGRFRRFQSSPFDGFLATPITPFPKIPFTGRPLVFGTPRMRMNSRPMHMRPGRHR